MRRCPAPDCKRQISPDMAYCRIHWFRLPQGIRRRVWAGYRGDPGSDHGKALAETQEFLVNFQKSNSHRSSSSRSGSSRGTPQGGLL